MLLTTTLPIKITKNNIKKYIDKGYENVHIGNIINIKIEDITKGSNKDIKLQCDYCGKEINRKLCDYNRRKEKDLIELDCCIDCRSLKTKQVFNKKYGVDNILELEEIKDKIKQTNLERYGYINPNSNKDILEKRWITNFNRYGVKIPTQNEEVKQKSINTCLEKYGVQYIVQSDVVKEKIRNTMYKHGNVPTSSQQIAVFNIIKELGYEPILNYPERAFSLDVALFIFGKKIDIEYDCCYWHQNVRKDVIRNKVLNNYGWNVIRVLSKSKLPTKNQLQIAIDNIINSDKKIQLIQLEDWELTIN